MLQTINFINIDEGRYRCRTRVNFRKPRRGLGLGNRTTRKGFTAVGKDWVGMAKGSGSVYQHGVASRAVRNETGRLSRAISADAIEKGKGTDSTVHGRVKVDADAQRAEATREQQTAITRRIITAGRTLQHIILVGPRGLTA